MTLTAKDISSLGDLNALDSELIVDHFHSPLPVHTAVFHIVMYLDMLDIFFCLLCRIMSFIGIELNRSCRPI